MEYGELIHDFVDGTLDSNHENGLFVELASNQNLRSELKQFIEFERTARYDTAAYAPSAESTAGVFSKLGIPLPLATTAAVTPAATGMWAFFGKYSQGIVGGIVAALMTAGVMYFAMDNKAMQTADSRQQTEIIQHDNVVNSERSIIASKDIPVVKSEEMDAPKVIEKVIIKYVDRPVFVEQSSIMDNGELVMENEEVATKKINIDNSDIAGIDNLPKVNLFTGINNGMSFNSVAVDEIPFNQNLGLSDYLGKLGFSVELTGADYIMFQKEEVPKSSNPILENNRIALVLRLTDNLQAGAEIRQEFFYHVYDDDKYDYHQNNNYQTANCFLRWIPFDYRVASFFGQLSYGGNIGGQVGRFMLGTLIKPNQEYSFILGIEGSVMTYYYNNETLLAPKIGLNYGMMFNF